MPRPRVGEIAKVDCGVKPRNPTRTSNVCCVSEKRPVLVLSYKLRYIVGFGLVEMAISTNPKPTIYLCCHCQS